MSPPPRPPRLLYLVTEDWYFCSHRLHLARRAKDAGFEVLVATRVTDHGPDIERAGLTLIPIRLLRHGRNPWGEAAAIREIVRIYRRERPDIVHHVALKPTLYGALAAWIAGVPCVVNALAGMGYVFVSNDLAAHLLRPLVRLTFRILLNRPGSRLVIQNPDDLRLLVEAGAIAPERAVLIRGAGVDMERFRPGPEAPGIPVAVLASRMLWDKGVGELVAAARLLGIRGVPVRILLLGEPDPANPAAIPRAELARWNAEGLVEWRGFEPDVAKALRACHIAVLPSYREGLPKSLLEAAAAGLPIVASDVPGCREIVRDGDNGILVPPRDAAALADAIARLALDPGLRARMGARGRALAEAFFSEAVVAEATLALYRDMLAAARRQSSRLGEARLRATDLPPRPSPTAGEGGSQPAVPSCSPPPAQAGSKPAGPPPSAPPPRGEGTKPAAPMPCPCAGKDGRGGGDGHDHDRH